MVVAQAINISELEPKKHRIQMIWLEKASKKRIVKAVVVLYDLAKISQYVNLVDMKYRDSNRKLEQTENYDLISYMNDKII